MEEVLVNLLRNAVEAAPDGEPVDLSVAIRPGHELTYEVRDHGEGLPPGDEERVFEPFFTRKTKGTGLGLALARRIVEGHGGRISAQQPRGRRRRLPGILALARARRAREQVSMERVLVVDDEEGIRSFITEVLEGEGLRVTQAPDGEAAARLLERESFHLMLTDLKMPRMDGMTLLRKARAEQPEMEVIVLTAHGTVESAVEAMKLGAFDYLGKPLSGPDELRLVVSRALERRRLREEHQRAAARGRRGRGRGGAGSGDAGHAGAAQEGGGHRRHRAALGRERHRQGGHRARPCTARAGAATGPSSRSTAPPCRDRCSKARCSATRRGRSPAPPRSGAAASSWPTAAPCSSTRWRRSGRSFRPSCCACCRSSASSAWAARAPSRSTCASSPPPTAIWREEMRAGSLPRGPVPPAGRVPHPSAAAARAAGRRRCRWPSTCSRASPGSLVGRPSSSTRRPGPRLVGYAWPGNVRELANVLERAAILADGSEHHGAAPGARVAGRRRVAARTRPRRRHAGGAGEASHPSRPGRDRREPQASRRAPGHRSAHPLRQAAGLRNRVTLDLLVRIP